MSRQHVHLSQDIDTAIKVGARRGKPIILRIRVGYAYKVIHFIYPKMGLAD